MTARTADLREEATRARANAEASHFPDIKNEWLRIAAEYERLASFIDGLPGDQDSN
jgi:hypothetical protein